MSSFLPIMIFVLSLVFLFWIVYKRNGITTAILQVLPFIFFTIALETGFHHGPKCKEKSLRWEFSLISAIIDPFHCAFASLTVVLHPRKP